MYNTKSDVWTKYWNNIHKIISPETYPCSLCRLTHNNFSEKKKWKDFRKNTHFDFLFMYKNEFLELYSGNNFKNIKYPIVFEKETKDLKVVLDAEKLASIITVGQLIEFLQKKS